MYEALQRDRQFCGASVEGAGRCVLVDSAFVKFDEFPVPPDYGMCVISAGLRIVDAVGGIDGVSSRRQRRTSRPSGLRIDDEIVPPQISDAVRTSVWNPQRAQSPHKAVRSKRMRAVNARREGDSAEFGYAVDVIASAPLPALDPDAVPLELMISEVPADGARVGSIRRALTAWLEATRFDPTRIADVVLAVYEAMANTAEHAYRHASMTGTFTVRAAYSSLEHLLSIVVIDHGHWRPAVPDSYRGNGLRLVAALSGGSRVDHTDIGTTVSMYWTDGADPEKDQR